MIKPENRERIFKEHQKNLELFYKLVEKPYIDVNLTIYDWGAMLHITTSDLVRLKKDFNITKEIRKTISEDKRLQWANTYIEGQYVAINPKDGHFKGCRIEEKTIQVPAKPAHEKVVKIIVCGKEQ